VSKNNLTKTLIGFFFALLAAQPQASACVFITTNEMRTIENKSEDGTFDFARGTFWPNRNGSFDLGERVEFFRSEDGAGALNVRFKLRSGKIAEYAHAQRLYYQADSNTAPVVIASRAFKSPVGWQLVDGLSFEYETQKIPADHPKYKVAVSIITTSREMTSKLCPIPKAPESSSLLSATESTPSTLKDNRDRPRM
jgi:hypothetical protein